MIFHCNKAAKRKPFVSSVAPSELTTTIRRRRTRLPTDDARLPAVSSAPPSVPVIAKSPVKTSDTDKKVIEKKKRIGRPRRIKRGKKPKLDKKEEAEEPEEKEDSETTQKAKSLRATTLIKTMLSNENTRRREEADEEAKRKGRGRRRNTASPSKAVTSQARLSSVSSALSSVSSRNGVVETKANKEELPNEEDDVEMEDDVDDEIEDLDDIAVSDYEMEEETTESKEEVSRKVEEIAKSKPTLPEPSSLLEQPPSSDNSNGATLANAVSTLELGQSKELLAHGSYKVRIELRRPSNSSKSKENVEPDKRKASEPLSTPQKLSTVLMQQCLKINTASATPVKLASGAILTNSAKDKDGQTTGTPSANSFECPVCDKKFVSHYGLFQHYDQHPNLAVSCATCQLTFENHQALLVHNKNVHRMAIEPALLADLDRRSDKAQAQAKKPEVKNGSSSRPTIAAPKPQTKPKSQGDELLSASEAIAPNSELSALPSIMTRTSRLTNPQSSFSNAKPSLLPSVALIDHQLSIKTTGFADLSFIDFSCVSFPRIAQNYCELWPRRLSDQPPPLHNYTCDKCNFLFPCRASLVLHQTQKRQGHSPNKAPRCPLFMVNSKYLCYEKAIDEIITKIENQQIPITERQKEDEYFKKFDLEPVDQSMRSKKRNSLIPGLEKFNSEAIPPDNAHERLMLKLRRTMLEVNSQFEIDLDRWKLMHSFDDSPNGPGDEIFLYSGKVGLKPHVNLTRPLLIRSKKLKRNLQRPIAPSSSKLFSPIISTSNISTTTTTTNTPTTNTPITNTPTASARITNIRNTNTPTTNTPSANTPNANKPTNNTPTVNTPTANKPTVNTPTTNTPTTNTPTANTPTTITPTANMPTANKPTANKPTVNTHTANTPTTNTTTTTTTTTNTNTISTTTANTPTANTRTTSIITPVVVVTKTVPIQSRILTPSLLTKSSPPILAPSPRPPTPVTQVVPSPQLKRPSPSPPPPPPPILQKPQITVVTPTPKLITSTIKPSPVTTKFSKPFFSATSGNFSAAVNLNSIKTNENLSAKKRKLLPSVKFPNRNDEQKAPLNKKRREESAEDGIEESDSDIEELIDDEEEEVEKEKADDIKREMTKTLQKVDKQEENKKDEYSNTKATGKVEPKPIDDVTKGQRPQPAISPRNSFQRSQSFNNKSIVRKPLIRPTNESAQILPPPPPLYKAPMLHTTSYNSSANSSILASASGMSNPLAFSKNQLTMPKLQPIGMFSKNNPSNQIMVKNQVKPSHPPLLIRPALRMPQMATAEASKFKANETIRSKADLGQSGLNQSGLNQSVPTPVRPHLPNKQSSTQSHSVSSSNPLPKPKNSENLSLKCKFCLEIFKGQSEFFQHVIVSHPKMLEQRLNRKRAADASAGATTNTNSTNPQTSSTTFSTA